MMLLGGYFALHISIAYVYVMEVYSRHDYSVVCERSCENGEAYIDHPAQMRRSVYVGTSYCMCFVVLVFWIFSMNDSAVLMKYFLLSAFLLITVLDGFLSFRIKFDYDL